MARHSASKRILIQDSFRGPLYLLVDAFVLVLRELALLDLVFPARLVALGPLAAAQFRDRRLAVPGLAVALALVALLGLRLDDLVALAAGGKPHEGDKDQCRSHERVPLGCCCCCGGCAPGLPGP